MTGRDPGTVTVEDRDGIAIVTLDNPDRRNALSVRMTDHLAETIETMNADPAVRAIVLTGAGENFCAGVDVNGLTAKPTLGGSRMRTLAYHRALRPILYGAKPVVAAVEGKAYGAGMALALACDHVVGAANAVFCSAFARIGFMPDMGLMWTLPQRIGVPRAKEVIALSTEIGGREAGEMGIIDTLCEPGESLSAALGVAERFAGASPAAFMIVKSAFADGSAFSLEGTLRKEMDNQPALRLTDEHQRAVATFTRRSGSQRKGK